MTSVSPWKLFATINLLVFAAACGPGGGGKDAGPDCTGTQTECSGTCVDILSSAEHCGACGNACGTGTACAAGVCIATCGDGVKAASEACDDGNTATGDGCDGACAIESGWSCMGSPSACTTGCGDGIVAGMEACDDGNATAGDGCSEACAQETGYTCSGEPSTCATTCGDGAVAGAEQCDDGNTAAADGCDATCATETGYACTGAPSVCAAVCGDGVVLGNEACDDANTTAGDGCDATCAVESGYACAGAPSTCTATCGDGLIVGTEQCDDGNATAGDGCSEVCAPEPGFTCSGTPSACTTTCGDGIPAGMEMCDDGNLTAGDGCGASCATETGYACTGAPSVCATVCGDGAIVGAEVCDDGNTTAGDGCDAACAIETGFTCSMTSPSTCTAVCGDGAVLGAETCDDGNIAAGDGCDAACATEPGYTCTGSPSTCAPKVTCATGSTLVTIASTDLPKTIDDTTPNVTSTVSTAAAGVVTLVAAEVTVLHAYVADLELSLRGPNNENIDLSSDNGSNGVDYVDTLFIDSATDSITTGMAPFTGSYKPEQPLSKLEGQLAAGSWVLEANDDYASLDDGQFTKFTLYLCVCTTCETGVFCSDSADNDTDGQVDCADSDCAAAANCQVCGDGQVGSGEECDDGNAAAGDGCSATCEVEVGYACTGAPSVCASKVTCPTGSNLQALASSDLPKPINGTTTTADSVIAVTGGGVVVSAAAEVTIEHAYNEDLDLFLLSPAGTQVELSTANGGSTEDYLQTLFTDSATASITTGTGPFTGEYKPEQPLSTVNGELIAGNWTLRATDTYASSDDGTFNDFTLYLCVCTTCETGAACGDMVDNDSDGLVDCQDSDCSAVPACIVPVCGNGTVEGTETCDDGNTTAGDGCSATCQYEYASEAETNDTAATANAATLGVLQSAAISPVGDEDFFSFTLSAVSDVEIETWDQTGPASCTAVDTVIRLYATDGMTVLAIDDEGGVSSCSKVDPVADTGARQMQPGTYYFSVYEYGDNATINYVARVRAVATCGNAKVEGSETCDDGNTTPNDGCDASCQTE